jgi:formaldehyde-activating enzyme involved in methanogenesis
MVMHLPCALAAVSEAVQVRFTVSRPSLLYRWNCRSAQLAIRTACRKQQHVHAVMGPCSRNVHPMTRHRSCKRELTQKRST